MPENHICISVGNSCISASIIRDLNLNNETYPLNWIITPSESLLNLFRNDFNNFFEKENLSIGGPGAPNFIGVFDNLYNIHSRHDFKESIDFFSQYNDIRDKYLRRIKRLYKLMNSADKKIYFLRFFDLTKDQAIEFTTIISKKFPNLSYQLIYISNDDKEGISWNLDLVKNYFVKEENMWDVNTYVPIFLDASLYIC